MGARIGVALKINFGVIMKNMKVAFSVFIVFVASMAAAAASAGEDSGEPLVVSGQYARATPPGAPNGAAYMVIENRGEGDLVIKSASSPVARAVEFHGHSRHKGMMKMKAMGEFTIGAASMKELKPGAMHLMLIGLKAPLKAGDEVAVTFYLKGGGEVAVEVPVKGVMDKVGE